MQRINLGKLYFVFSLGYLKLKGCSNILYNAYFNIKLITYLHRHIVIAIAKLPFSLRLNILRICIFSDNHMHNIRYAQNTFYTFIN